MKKNLLSVIAVAAILAGCQTFGHQYHNVMMKGSVVNAYDNGGVVCIGKKDGAKTGQVLNVYQIVTKGSGKGATFERQKTGEVVVAEIIDEHFARVNVKSGKITQGSIVEID